MIDAKEYLKKMSAELDGPIKSYIGDEEPKVLMDAAKQYPFAGGKRMRPAMAVACCKAVGGDGSKAVPLAVAIEYIHNFTLIHDDIMDGDEKRRGMPTIHVGYGEPTAILAGDALFAKAYQIIANLDVPAENMRDVLKYVAQAVWDLARGQQMDINNEGQIVFYSVCAVGVQMESELAEVHLFGDVHTVACDCLQSPYAAHVFHGFACPVGVAVVVERAASCHRQCDNHHDNSFK